MKKGTLQEVAASLNAQADEAEAKAEKLRELAAQVEEECEFDDDAGELLEDIDEEGDSDGEGDSDEEDEDE